MLKDSQKEILDNWDDADRKKKDRIKNHLAENLAEIPLLRKIGPNDAYDVVQDAVKKYHQSSSAEDYRYYDPRQTSEQAAARNDYAMWTIALLYNGLDGETINHGVNHGIKQTLLWRKDHGVKSADEILRRISLHRRESVQNNNKFWPFNPSTPPTGDEMRLKRIFQLDGSDRLLEQQNFQVLLNFGEDAIYQADSFGNILLRDDDGNYLDNSQDLLREAADAIEQNKNYAEKFAHILNNPQNKKLAVIPNTDNVVPDWYIREYIYLQRDHLKSKGILPDDDALPDYDGVPYRDPTELNFSRWYWSE